MQPSGSEERGDAGADRRDDGGAEERIIARAGIEREAHQEALQLHSALPPWISPNLAGAILLIFSVGLVLISMFQAVDNYYAHRRQDRQGAIIRDQGKQITDLSERIKEDDQFFDTVRQLIILGPDATPAQRQAIIDQLRSQEAAHQAAQSTTTTTVAGSPKGKGGQNPPSQSGTTTTTTQPSSPPPSSPPPSSPPPGVQVCANGTCVTTPPLPTIPHP
jgi:hypothetical protein